jgi:hypothetical protein
MFCEEIGWLAATQNYSNDTWQSGTGTTCTVIGTTAMIRLIPARRRKWGASLRTWEQRAIIIAICLLVCSRYLSITEGLGTRIRQPGRWHRPDYTVQDPFDKLMGSAILNFDRQDSIRAGPLASHSSATWLLRINSILDNSPQTRISRQRASLSPQNRSIGASLPAEWQEAMDEDQAHANRTAAEAQRTQLDQPPRLASL